jgi:hypothetical protein
VTTTIRPPRLDRILFVIVFGPVWIGTGLTLVSLALDPEASARAFLVVLGAVFVMSGVWLLVRLPRVAIHLSDDTLRYDGFLVSWSVPRAGITAVIDDTYVEWRDLSGNDRRRQLGMLAPAHRDDGTKFAPYWRWRREGLLQVRAWAADTDA